MTVQSPEIEGRHNPEKELIKDIPFREAVIINGLPYVFEGKIPEEPTDFDWSVSVPNWNEQEVAAYKMMLDGKIPKHFDDWLKRHNLDSGRAGIIELEKAVPNDKAPSLRVGIVQTETHHFPPEFGYQDAVGVGSFLLNNICELADLKNWRVYLNPVDKGGALTQGDLYAWYQRRGFKDPYLFPKETHYSDHMQRMPRESDNTQAISKILEKAGSNGLKR